MRISVLLLGLAVAGIASTARAASGPCDLVTQAEVKAAVGGEVSEGKPNKNNKAVCDFKVGDTGSLLNVSLTDKASSDSAERTVEELKKRKIAATLVPGIGDGAYASSPGYGMQQLGAYKGGKQVIVTAMIMGAPEAKVKAIIEKVMRKALGRL